MVSLWFQCCFLCVNFNFDNIMWSYLSWESYNGSMKNCNTVAPHMVILCDIGYYIFCYLLIDNVHAQDTESIKLLDSARASKLVECTFGHPRIIVLRNILWSWNGKMAISHYWANLFYFNSILYSMKLSQLNPGPQVKTAPLGYSDYPVSYWCHIIHICSKLILH